MEYEPAVAREEQRVQNAQRPKLNADTLSQLSKASKKSSKSKKQRPAWAMTEKQQVDEQEKEVDELIEFAYELDYEKYMEDYEVRQALAVIKDRVNEIKQNDDWKENIAKEWNEATDKEMGGADDKEQQQV
jgi:hypothetical protein